MWWILILSIVGGHVELAVVEDFGSEELCIKAGEDWVKNMKKITVSKGVIYTCAKRV